MPALITQAQLEVVLGTGQVAALSDATEPLPDSPTADATVVAAIIEEVSDWAQEHATAAGVTLTAGALTAAMRRRLCFVWGHWAGSRRPQFRDAQGRAPYHVEHAAAEKWMEEWGNRLRQTSDDTASEAPVVLSDDARGWSDTSTDDEDD